MSIFGVYLVRLLGLQPLGGSFLGVHAFDQNLQKRNDLGLAIEIKNHFFFFS